MRAATLAGPKLVRTGARTLTITYVAFEGINQRGLE
jgi:hypothetical protein